MKRDTASEASIDRETKRTQKRTERKRKMERYIDFQDGKPHSAEEHYAAAKALINSGYRWTHSTFGNPSFYKDGEGTVTIISSIVAQDGYFAFSD